MLHDSPDLIIHRKHTKLIEITDTVEIMTSQHFRSDPADIRIRIYPKIRIRIPSHFWLKLRPWRSLRSLGTLVIITPYAAQQIHKYNNKIQ